MSSAIHVVGGGLSGSEAAWQIASLGVPVVLHEMRPLRRTDAHRTDGLAELVCSNSLRSDDHETNAIGLLHEKMGGLNPLVMRAADGNQVPAGGALAVDRDGFSAAITAAIEGHPLIEIVREEIATLPADWNSVIVATGPLTSPALAQSIGAVTGESALAFFDAIAPIVHRDSIDMSVAWFQSRYDKTGPGGTGADYINCPMDRAQYDAFVAALLAGDKTQFHEWEKSTPYFDGCLPIEVMAERGVETLRHGPMKPVGLTNPHDPQTKAYAIVGRRGDAIALPPKTTAQGALLGYITGAHINTIDAGPRSYQPMNVNFGLFPPLKQIPTKAPDGTRLRGPAKAVAKKRAMCARALADLDQWIGGARIAAE